MSKRRGRRSLLATAFASLGALTVTSLPNHDAGREPRVVTPAAPTSAPCPRPEPHVQSANAAEHRVLEAKATARVQSANAAEHRVLERSAARSDACGS